MPNAEGWFRSEGNAYIRISSDGLRDREHTRSKPPGTLRIAVLGDSYAEALQVPMDQTFWSVMEKALGDCLKPSRRVEVINFGVSRFGTAQELMMLRSRVWEFDPDIVLLAFTSQNDVTDNSRELAQDPERPYFLLREGALVLDDSFRAVVRAKNTVPTRFLQQLSTTSRLVQLLREARTAIASQLAWRGIGSGGADFLRGEQLRDREMFRVPTGSLAEAWLVTEALLNEMNTEVRSHGSRFYVVTLSSGAQVDPNKERREALAAELAVPNLDYADLRVQAAGTRDGYAVLRLAPVLREYAVSHNVSLHYSNFAPGDGHWNSTAHRIAGEMIATDVCAKLS